MQRHKSRAWMIVVLALLLATGNVAWARRGGGGFGGFHSGGFGHSFGGRGFGHSFSAPSGGFGRRSGGGFSGFGFGRRSGGTSTLSRPSSTPGVAPPSRPGGFGHSSLSRSSGTGIFGFGRSRPTNFSSRAPSARPLGAGSAPGAYRSARVYSPYSGRTVVVYHNQPYYYDYHPFGVWVPYGSSPWGFYGYHYWPWMFSNPYPPSYGYTSYGTHAGFLASLFATAMLLALLAFGVWIVVKIVRSFSGGGGGGGRGYDRPARYS